MTKDKKRGEKILYLDCPMGISGDMTVAALIDLKLGLDLAVIESEIKKLPMEGYSIRVGTERRKGISGTRFLVELALEEKQPHRRYLDIKKMIEESELSDGVKARALKVFEAIAVAEAQVHGTTPDEVSFHEVGAIDSIIDIVALAVGVDMLGVERIVISPVPPGSGWAETAHGKLPIPAPATLKLLEGLRLAPSLVEAELTTPTGAAIAAALSDGSGPMPEMVVAKVGTGVGTKDFTEAPNLLRAVFGEAKGIGEGEDGDEVVVVMETNIDDTSPEVAGYLMEKLLEAGALDVFFTPVTMKKSRPGMLLTVLSSEAREAEFLDIIFTESTTIGVRCHRAWRHILTREIVEVQTRYGNVRVKVSGREEGFVENFQPEYEDVRRIAKECGAPFKEIFDDARRAAEKGR